MKSLDTWLDQYGESHKNPTNQRIHYICVPLITWSILGILWSIPTPSSFGVFNWAWAFVCVASTFYFSLRSAKAIVVSQSLVLPFMLLTHFYLYEALADKFLLTMIVVFILSWIAQFIGHKIEGKKPSFFEDLQFLLIGPLWVFLGHK